jgi:hypothetical protein
LSLLSCNRFPAPCTSAQVYEQLRYGNQVQ